MGIRFSPYEYKGESLCPRCGDNGNGDTYQICDEGLYSHQISCERYIYGDLCTACEEEVTE